MNPRLTTDGRTGADVPTCGPGGMYVEESGTPGSPAIVFVHGAGQSGCIWHEHLTRLSDFHCLAPDLLGFGRSNELPSVSLAETADLLAELIETRVPARRASVVGISSGGATIHRLLGRHPDRVERAIIDGAPAYPRIRALRRLFWGAMSTLLHTRLWKPIMGDVWDPAELRDASRRAFRRAVAECFRPFAVNDAPCPTLLVAGEQETGLRDFYIDTRRSNAALAELMPTAEARFAPGLFHCWQLKAPDLHIRMVEAWVSGQALPSELRPEPTPPAATVKRLRAEAAATA
jgi:pimeloyl-ACP methyl ester carboxylesterase